MRAPLHGSTALPPGSAHACSTKSWHNLDFFSKSNAERSPTLERSLTFLSEQGIFGSISQKPIDSDPIGSDVAAGLGQQPRFQHVSSRHGKGSQSPSEETAS